MKGREAFAVCAVLACALCGARAAASDPYEALAAGLDDAVVPTGAKTVEMMPLVDARGKVTPEGRMLSTRLLSRFLARKKLSFVLGSLPDPIVEPYAAALDDLDARALRRRLGPAEPPAAQIVVLGSYVVVRDRIKLNLQAVAVASGKVLYAGELDVRNEWESVSEFWQSAPTAPLRMPQSGSADLMDAPHAGHAALAAATAPVALATGTVRASASFDPLAELLPAAASR